ncbi:unnamed protein product [Peronospora belbahrii]|uniref:Uncharacterized protein n=1 Tax=Peronospora belbahrii TaxID=622444 RepID=A0ABN8D792_9STRA|nr:unnamed protein product [Peronospora belbahrii]
MSSSYKQKKLKTLATRKKTRKRRIDDGTTFEDDSCRTFQPPIIRDPGWKKPSIDVVVSSISKTTRQKKAEKKRRKLATDQGQGEDDDIAILQQDPAPSEEEQDLNAMNFNSSSGSLLTPRKMPLQLCNSMDDTVAKAIEMHADIRRKDGRQKTRVLLLVDARSIFKLMKKKMNIHSEMVKSKSRRGVGSAKKPEMVYKNTGLVKTPLNHFKDVNKNVLIGYKSGKLSSLLAQDLSFYPYTNFKVQHVIFVAKEAASAINLDRTLLQNVAMHLFVMNDKNTSGILENDIEVLNKVYQVTKA